MVDFFMRSPMIDEQVHFFKSVQTLLENGSTFDGDEFAFLRALAHLASKRHKSSGVSLLMPTRSVFEEFSARVTQKKGRTLVHGFRKVLLNNKLKFCYKISVKGDVIGLTSAIIYCLQEFTFLLGVSGRSNKQRKSGSVSPPPGSARSSRT